MELKLSEFVLNIDGKPVTMEEMVAHWQRTHHIAPANAQTCYGYYRAANGEDQLTYAMWHPDTVPNKNERMVPGYFVPQVEYARHGINDAHQLICNEMGRHVQVTDALERDVMHALQNAWTPKDRWESAVRVALKRSGFSTADLSRSDDPEEILRELASYWQTFGEAQRTDAFKSDAIKDAVNRFLGWRLPKTFAPDCGVSFNRDYAQQGSWPIGTNLFNADEATEMFSHCLSSLTKNGVEALEDADLSIDMQALKARIADTKCDPTEITAEMHQAGDEALRRASADGCASLHVLCKVYFEACVLKLADQMDPSFEFTPHSGLSPSKEVVKYCDMCERPEFNGHDRGCPRDVEAIPEPADDAHMIDDDALWPPSGLFRHTDGGMYEVIYGATSSEDKSRVVVYRHRWPFEPGVWTRPYSEWNSRFTYITFDQYQQAVDAMKQDQAQILVTKNRTERKAREARHLQNQQDEDQGLDPVLEMLDDIEIRSGSSLYDAQGKLWTARVPKLKGYSLMMRPDKWAEGDPTWHTNLLDHESLPVLFWNNPHKDLRLRWQLRRLNGLFVWETETPFGLLQVEYQPMHRFPWRMRALSINQFFSSDEGWATANSAMQLVERKYFKRVDDALAKQ